MNFLDKKLNADIIAFEHNIPNEKTKQNKKNLDSIEFQELGSTFENWKNRGNNGEIKQTSSSLFFNKKNLK